MRSVLRLVSLAAVVAVAVPALQAQQRAAPARPRPSAASPQLYVIISVDQMRGDYLTRYGHQWTKGLRRLVDEGARFTRAVYPYFNTVTCAGHATIGTGAFPSTHGMVLNQWFDRTTGINTACTDDPTATAIAYGDGDLPKISNSGARLLVPTFADELRAQSDPAPRVVSMSLKPRSAIGMAGHGGDVVLWYDGGRFMTSTAFARAKTPFIDAYTSSHPISQGFGKSWVRSLPESAYLFDDEGEGEAKTGWTKSFPHTMTGRNNVVDASFYADWEYSPAADDYLGALAIESLGALKLGQQAPRRDVLAVSFSVLDLHRARLRPPQPRGAGRDGAPRRDHREAPRRARCARGARQVRRRAHRRSRGVAHPRADDDARVGCRAHQPRRDPHEGRRGTRPVLRRGEVRRGRALHRPVLHAGRVGPVAGSARRHGRRDRCRQERAGRLACLPQRRARCEAGAGRSTRHCPGDRIHVWPQWRPAHRPEDLLDLVGVRGHARDRLRVRRTGALDLLRRGIRHGRVHDARDSGRPRQRPSRISPGSRSHAPTARSAARRSSRASLPPKTR